MISAVGYQTNMPVWISGSSREVFDWQIFTTKEMAYAMKCAENIFLL